MTSHKRVRQVDVAKLAGVSTAVVSSVLSNRTSGSIRVGKDAERRVWEAVRELGYVPNLVATSLANGDRRLFGVFTFEPVFTERHRGFYVPFLLGVEREAERQGYDLVLFTSTSGAGRRRSVFADGANRLGLAAGAILIGREPDKATLSRLLRERYPFVFIGRREVPEGAVAYVAADYASATRSIVDHLSELGHRSFRLVIAGDGTESEVDRLNGYRAACAGLGIQVHDVEASVVGASTVTANWVAATRSSGVTAILVENDAIGRRMVEVATEAGLEIPGDVSLAVLGDPLDDPHDVPDWLSFTIPRLEMGEEAVKLLIQVVAGAPLESARVTLSCTLVEGATAGPARSSLR